MILFRLPCTTPFYWQSLQTYTLAVFGIICGKRQLPQELPQAFHLTAAKNNVHICILSGTNHLSCVQVHLCTLFYDWFPDIFHCFNISFLFKDKVPRMAEMAVLEVVVTKIFFAAQPWWAAVFQAILTKIIRVWRGEYSWSFPCPPPLPSPPCKEPLVTGLNNELSREVRLTNYVLKSCRDFELLFLLYKFVGTGYLFVIKQSLRYRAFKISSIRDTGAFEISRVNSLFITSNAQNQVLSPGYAEQ